MEEEVLVGNLVMATFRKSPTMRNFVYTCLIACKDIWGDLLSHVSQTKFHFVSELNSRY